MKSISHLQAAVLLTLGLACAATALVAYRSKAPSAETLPSVVVSYARTESAELVPTVTITARKLTADEKSMMAQTECSQPEKELAVDASPKKAVDRRT